VPVDRLLVHRNAEIIAERAIGRGKAVTVRDPG
jgi:hypothetical protein